LHTAYVLYIVYRTDRDCMQSRIAAYLIWRTK